jgi:hypothetical protein
MFKRHHSNSKTPKHPMRRRLAVATLAAAATMVGGLALTAGAAQADTINGFTVNWSSGASPLGFPYDGMDMAVPESSTAPGTGIIQWTPDNGSEQNWYIGQVYNPNGTFVGDMIRNQNSNLCIQTDGYAGDTVYQEPCNPANGLMVWVPNYDVTGWATYVSYTNEAVGLNLDVYGDSYGAGANIDAWYPNSQDNQEFLAS